MSFQPGGIGPVTVSGDSGSKITTPTVVNILVPTANSEQSYTFPTGTKMFRLSVRQGARLQLSFSAGTSGTDFITRFPGFTYESPSIPLDAVITVYFQCSKNSQTVEVESWV